MKLYQSITGEINRHKGLPVIYDSFRDGVISNLQVLTNKGYYIQSAYNLHDDDKVKQEENSLRHIGDSYKKLSLHMRIYIRRSESGITYMSIFDFLLNPNSLEI